MPSPSGLAGTETAARLEGRSARCYVVCTGNIVVGYYCLATGAVAHHAALSALKRNMPNPIPTRVIGRLAVDVRHQGHGIGRGLLQDALKRVSAAPQSVGARAVMVHAIDHSAVPFYVQYGFKAFPAGSTTLVLPIETIAAAL